MAQSNPPNQTYAPLPLTNDDHIGEALYNAPNDNIPPSPSFQATQFSTDDLSRPRFLGPALYSEGGQPPRASYAESQHTYASRNSEYNSSVYGLNDAPGPAPLSQSFYAGSYRDNPSELTLDRDVPMSPMGRSRMMEEKRAIYAPPRSRRKVIVIAILIASILLIAAVLIPLYFAVIKPKSGTSNNNGKGPSSTSTASDPSNSSKPKSAIVTGGNGSKVKTEGGAEFTYTNSFGGYWYWDEEDPFNNGARAQSWTPALNETFRYGIDKIRGVNLGGWLTLEPFICPNMFEPYADTTNPAVDEFTLHTIMAANGGFDALEEHYKTFITEQDFAEIAAAGLNYVRLPIPFWAIETRDGEPFHTGTAWKYFLKGIQWARKYGIRINLDFHALPGSQNGWNHSGRLGTVNFLNGPMGIVNAQRALDYIRIMAEFIAQPQYKDVVTMFGITNEPQEHVVGRAALESFYLEAYKIVRNAGGVGEGNGPWISLHDGFLPRDQWGGFLPNADRLTLDSHPYLCFGPQSDAPMSSYANTPCRTWGASVNRSMAAFGLTNAGEFSNAVTDCGLWVNGVGQGTRYEGDYIGSPGRVGDCSIWTDWQNWTPAFKNDMKNFAMASMDALQNYFFWTWKIANSTRTGKVEAPQWSYQLGLQNGWMPEDPREAEGYCGNTDPWSPPLQPWQTGGAGAGNIPAAVTNTIPWPPATISNAGAATLLPSLTPTGAVPTLPGPTFSFSTATATPSVGNGWANPADTAGLMVPISTCSYLGPYPGPTTPPSPLCS